MCQSSQPELWPPIEFEREAHRLAREDERGKLLSQCQREIISEQSLDDDAPTCDCGEVAHPLILIHAATRAMERYAAQRTASLETENAELRKALASSH